MNNIQHIHQVIFLVGNNNDQWTPKELEEAIGKTWGEDVQFGSCSGNAFPKEQALNFLLNKEKVVLTKEGRIKIHPTMHMCDSHEGFQG